MDAANFDRIAKALSGSGPRRAALRALAGMLPGLGLAQTARDEAEARCGKGRRKCNGRCRNLRRDEDNCGRCGRRCGPRETCVDGRCVKDGGGGGGGACGGVYDPCGSDADCCFPLECRTLGISSFCYFR